jgi:hypothetical protein
VKVLWPGIRRAEGKEKGKGVAARRGLEEAQSELRGDEQKPDMRRDASGASGHVTVKPSICGWRAFCKSGVYAVKVDMESDQVMTHTRLTRTGLNSMQNPDQLPPKNNTGNMVLKILMARTEFSVRYLYFYIV